MAIWIEVTDQYEPELASHDGTLHGWLQLIESALWKMLAGVFLFALYRLPYRICEFLIHTAGPVAIRLTRVACLLALLLAVIFGPAGLTESLDDPLPFQLSLGWIVLAFAGAGWGHRFVRRKRRAAAAHAEPSSAITEVVTAGLVAD